MRIYAVLLSLSLLLGGCAGRLPVFAEHEEYASMKSAVEIGLCRVELDGSLVRMPLHFPAELELAQTVADRFLLENVDRLSADTTATVSVSNSAATVDIGSLPPFQTGVAEEAFLCAVVLTLTDLPHIDAVSFLFDGESLAALPGGTPCSGTFRPSDFLDMRIS